MLSLDLKALNEKNAAAAEQREQAVQASLARLLASENIHVEFKKVHTASFNVASRVLTIPLYAKDLKPEVVAMNVAHEVGHAIWTPAQGWFEHIDKYGMMFKDYLNVIEDIRINKLIKRKYPGVIRDFHIGYRDLYDNEFYGSKEKISNTLSTMYMVDRINLYGKVGEIVGDFAFTAEERALMDRAEKNETFEEVIALAHDVMAYDKRLIANRKESADEMMKELDRLLHQDTVEKDLEDEDDGLDEPRPSTINSDAEKNDLSDMDEEGSDNQEVTPMADEGEELASADSDENSEEDELSASGSSGKGNEKDDDEQQTERGKDNDEEITPHSFTEEQYQNNENKLLDVSARDVIYLECPNAPKLSTFLIPSRFVSTAFERVVKESSEYYNIENKDEEFQNRVSKFIRKFNDKHQRYITHLVREFEMRRNAEQFARSLESKTGALNLNKMHQYKFSDDLFKRITIVSKGKNHGMLMFIDASGSMAGIIGHVIEQAAVMASFCRRVNIPFKVVTFTTAYNKNRLSDRFGFTFETYVDLNKSDPNISRIKFDDQLFALELLSDTMSLTKFNAALYCIVNEFSTLLMDGIVQMGGTPLDDIILALPQFVNNFRQNNAVEKVVAMYLTDGDGYGHIQYATGVYPNASRNILFVKSPFSSKIYEVESERVRWSSSKTFTPKCYTKTVLKMVKDTTGAELIGYHVASGRTASKLLQEYKTYCTQDVEQMKTEFRRNLFMSIDNFGYDEYFIMWDKVFRNRDLTLDGVTKRTSVKGMATAFTDMQNSKMVNRVFLTKFATAIS